LNCKAARLIRLPFIMILLYRRRKAMPLRRSQIRR